MWRIAWVRRSMRAVVFLLGLFFLSSFTYALYLRWFPPFSTSLMVIRSMEPPYGKEEGRTKIEAEWRSGENISPHMRLAVIASEDQNFFWHNGFDFDAIQAAFRHNMAEEGTSLKGGSTISQQVAKNVFLWPDRSWLRKGLETYFTLLIEILWPKERILEMYLNIAELGDGVFGVQAAARHYFHKDALELSQAEAAALAAILPSPRKWDPKGRKYSIPRRISRIRRDMNRLGGIKFLETKELPGGAK